MSMIGRDHERAALRQFVEDARRGTGSALVISGDAGCGKSTLLEHVAVTAAGFRVLRVTGFESERDIAFAAAYGLLSPFVARREVLPPLQRAAIESAFGLASAAPADRFIVGLATLSLLADAATDCPVLCLVDDAHWLDDESLAALVFAARRLGADRVAMLFAVRDGTGSEVPIAGLPTLPLLGLDHADAVELLRSVVSGPIDSLLAQRLIDETMGSPLALVELASGRTAHQLTAEMASLEPLPIGRRLEDYYLSEVRALPAATQTLLALASADGSREMRLLVTAASTLGLTVDTLAPAETAGLIRLHRAIQFRHPLVRSAIYGSLSVSERRDVHRTLGEAAAKIGDDDRRAWHLGAATAEPNEDIAAELEAAAGRALRRGGCAASAAFYERAAQLTPDPRHRVDRALHAAQRHLTAGLRTRARDIVVELAAEIDDPRQRAQMDRLDGAIRYADGDTTRTASILLGAARAMAPFDSTAARRTLLEALAAAQLTGPFTSPGEDEVDVAMAARAIPVPVGQSPSIADLLLDGDSAVFLGDHSAAGPLLRRAIEAFDADLSESDEMLWLLGIGCWAADALGDDGASYRLASRLERTARMRGAPVPLWIGLWHLGLAELFAGDLSAARLHFAERADLLEATGRWPDVGHLLIAAWSGSEQVARTAAESVTAQAMQSRHGWLLWWVDYASGVLELGLGNYAAAFDVACRDYQLNPRLSVVAFPDLIEAATRAGERAAAEQALAEFETRAAVYRTPLMCGLLARGQAMLADESEAESLFLESIDRLLLARGAVHGARSRLLYGEWLRRRKRRNDASEQLHQAHNVFDVIGARHFAERTRLELAACGERARRRRVDTSFALTPQEERVAQLAASGSTNAEIAVGLFVSASTVDYHLRKVYRKLGVTSRRQLSVAIAAQRS